MPSESDAQRLRAQQHGFVQTELDQELSGSFPGDPEAGTDHGFAYLRAQSPPRPSRAPAPFGSVRRILPTAAPSVMTLPMLSPHSSHGTSLPPMSHRSVSVNSSTNGSQHSTQSGCNGHHHHHNKRKGHENVDDDEDEADNDGHVDYNCTDLQCAKRVAAAKAKKLPSSHYYIDDQGRLRVRKMWWLFTRVRRVMTVMLPGFKPDSNTFLCAPMMANTMLMISLFVLRLLINHIVFMQIDKEGAHDAGHQQCHRYSKTFLDSFSYTMIGNIMLCLPAFEFSICKLFHTVGKAKSLSLAASTGPTVLASDANGGTAIDDDAAPRVAKTHLLRICELLVIFEIPFLIYTLVDILFVSNSNVFSATSDCYHQLSAGVFIGYLVVQILGLIAYCLRWNQIILFHRMHAHFLFQRGCVPGRARFEYVERSFHAPLFASAYTKHVHSIKKALYRAAKNGDIDEVRRLVEEAIEIDGPDFSTKWYEIKYCGGEKALFARCQRNPLHVAVIFDQIEVVQELLSNGHFDVHQMEKIELLKLGISWVYHFLFQVVGFLDKNNISRKKIREPFGPVGLGRSTLLTPLHAAVTIGNIDMVLLLLRYGANPNVAAKCTNRKFATPPLYWVVNKECARLLLDADANPLHVPGKGFYLTPFEVARILGNNAVAVQMEKYGADVALTPLHDASAKGFKDEVKFYLEHGADPDVLGEKVVGFFKRTPLHWAAIRGQTRVVKVLLRYGAKIDALDVFGRTPLMWAAVLNRVKTVEVLLQNGAAVNVRDVQGDPILCLCAAGACTTMANSMAIAQKQSNRQVTDASSGPQSGGSHAREEHNHVPENHNSLARSMDPQIFQLLQDNGVDLHATRECNGDTALHVALRKNNESAAIMFVRAGIPVTSVNMLGQRALECATSSSLRYAIKKEAGHRDVMISYCHSHSGLARKLRDSLEKAHVTTWIDSMDPSGITGGSVWRQEIAKGIQSSALVLALLTQDYPASQWCMKELAFAKMQNVPVVAVQCEDMEITEELQVYLWTRQIIDFRSAVQPKDHSPTDAAKKGNHANNDDAATFDLELQAQTTNKFAHDYDEDAFRNCMRLLLDGIQDQIEEHRVRSAQRQQVREALKKQTTMEEEAGSGSDGECAREPGLRRTNTSFLAGSSMAMLLNATENSASSYVFLAHGDYHASFCRRLKMALAKQGIRCVVDQAVPAVQYTAGVQTNGNASSHSGVSTNQNDATSMSVQARQMAAKDAILECSAVLVVLSSLSAKCDMLADQLAFAEDRGKTIVPVLLSLHQVDLAKRYTFSRSVIQHFNVSIGFSQSVERLVTYVRAQTEQNERNERRRLRQSSNDPSSASSGSVPGSPRFQSIVEISSPSNTALLTSDADAFLPPVLPIVQPRKQNNSGHGWSNSPTHPPVAAEESVQFQHEHLHSGTLPSSPMAGRGIHNSAGTGFFGRRQTSRNRSSEQGD